MNEITLWHGGRDLEYSYESFGGSTKKRWEHGPGLYLTTHYETASKYAKGGGKTYLVTIEEGNDIEKTFIDTYLVKAFVSEYLIKSKQKVVLEDINEHLSRVKDNGKICASILLNLTINHDAIASTKTHFLNHFLVDNGVDFGYITRFTGRDETAVVVFNNKKIKKVKAVMAKNVNLEDYELHFDINSFTHLNSHHLEPHISKKAITRKF